MSTETLTIGKALNLGLRRAMEDDAKVVLMGEDIGRLGGVFRITDGLQKDFGEDRVVDTPLAEAGILGTAVGLAMRGYRPVCEIQFDGFVFPAYNQIVTQVAKIHARSQGKVPMPIVIRIPMGGGIGAVEHHSESPESYFAHTAGLKVVAVSNPVDAYFMIQQAVACDDPVVESVRRTGHLVVVSEAPSESSITSEVAARVQQEAFYSLEAPVLRVGAFDTPYPPSRIEEDFLPDLDRVLDAVDRSMGY